MGQQQAVRWTVVADGERRRAAVKAGCQPRASTQPLDAPPCHANRPPAATVGSRAVRPCLPLSAPLLPTPPHAAPASGAPAAEHCSLTRESVPASGAGGAPARTHGSAKGSRRKRGTPPSQENSIGPHQGRPPVNSDRWPDRSGAGSGAATGQARPAAARSEASASVCTALPGQTLADSPPPAALRLGSAAWKPPAAQRRTLLCRPAP